MFGPFLITKMTILGSFWDFGDQPDDKNNNFV